MTRERVRWKIALLLNKMPQTCWADLVTWALKRDELRLTRNPSCRTDIERNGQCWCGKVKGKKP